MDGQNFHVNMRVAFMNEYGGAVKKIYKNTRSLLH